MIETVLIALVIAAVSPLAVFWTDSFVQRGRRVRAYNRLKSEPLMHEGVWLKGIELTGHHSRLVGRCQVTGFDVGRLVVTTEDGDKWVFTGREFEGLHPIYEASGHDRVP